MGGLLIHGRGVIKLGTPDTSQRRKFTYGISSSVASWIRTIAHEQDHVSIYPPFPPYGGKTRAIEPETCCPHLTYLLAVRAHSTPRFKHLFVNNNQYTKSSLEFRTKKRGLELCKNSHLNKCQACKIRVGVLCKGKETRGQQGKWAKCIDWFCAKMKESEQPRAREILSRKTKRKEFINYTKTCSRCSLSFTTIYSDACYCLGLSGGITFSQPVTHSNKIFILSIDDATTHAQRFASK
ncbi:uncharacterized protein BDR25DRAFT_352349 [Lindgomyces ingoldianus]|uniref:Uncharacterized protein n=1 Tax=Lindgomyces ingoldianus TaxID=673940 RepID=A0ACB6R5R8_9PLEO|nr:uncharacterized protein BDR25DRAFT_352349 [Lindgomyces ingoldianus]KAF2473877.1 hypothetical protein BDR25DRAFT_352349 [Lindgomyces ingoldianus]